MFHYFAQNGKTLIPECCENIYSNHKEMHAEWNTQTCYKYDQWDAKICLGNPQEGKENETKE